MRNSFKSKEPEQLQRGKEFQRIVQKDYGKNSNGGGVEIEKHVSFELLEKVRQKSGRMDIFISDLENGYVTIMEIKATDWDRIKSKNIKRNLYRHSRQLYRYIDKYMDVDELEVCPAMVYPKAPSKEGLRELVEQLAMDNYCFPVYWYDEIRTE